MTENQMFDSILSLNAEFVAPSKDQKNYLVDPILRELKKARSKGVFDFRLKVIEAFTGSGKSTVLAKHTIGEIQKYTSSVLILAPTEQLTKAMTSSIDTSRFFPILLNSTNIDTYIHPHIGFHVMPVFIATTSFFIHENNYSKFHELLSVIANKDTSKVPMTVFVDEAHKGTGSSSDLMFATNFGYAIRPGSYIAKTFNSIKTFVETGSAVAFCFTATPTKEQQGKISSFEDFVDYPDYFHQLSVYDRQPEKSPFTVVHHLPVDSKVHKVKDIKQVENYIRTYEKHGIWSNFRERCQIRSDLKIKKRPHMMIKVARKPNGIDFIPIKMFERVLKVYIEKTTKFLGYNWHNPVIARFSQQEAIIDGNYVHKDDYVDMINNINDRPIIQLVVDGLTLGTDFPFVSDVVALGIPSQVDPESIGNDEWNVSAIEQFVGRAMRLGTAPPELLVPKIIEMNLSNGDEQNLLDMIVEVQTKNIYLNTSDMHYQLTEKIESETFSPKEGRQFLNDALYGEKQVVDKKYDISNVIRIRNKLVHDHTNFTKKFKKNFCEYHSDACFEVSYKTYTKNHPEMPMTREKYRNSEIWDAQLHVDHIDGNRENNKESNFMTTCGNGHAEKTLLNGDCYNNYIA